MSDSTPGPPPPGPEVPPTGLPIEEPTGPYPQRFVETLRLFIISPREAFGRMSISSEILLPLSYALILSIYRAVVDLFWNYLIPFWPWILSDEGESAFVRLTSGFAGLIISPILSMIFLVIIAFVIHLVLMMIETGERGFDATLRVACYATTSMLAVAVPIFGGLAALVWWVVLMVFGIATVHQTSYEKATLGVVLPFVVCCASCCGLAALIGLIVGSSQ
jgi:hypothetical protein